MRLAYLTAHQAADVARRYAQRPKHSHRQMRHVLAHALSRLQHLFRRRGDCRAAANVGDIRMHPANNAVHHLKQPLTAAGDLPRGICHLLRVDHWGRQQEFLRACVVRKNAHRNLLDSPRRADETNIANGKDGQLSVWRCETDAVSRIALAVHVLHGPRGGNRQDGRRHGRLECVHACRETQKVVVQDDGVGIGISGAVGVADLQARVAYRTTQVGLHRPPDELFVTRLPACDTLVSPPGNAVASPRPFCTA